MRESVRFPGQIKSAAVSRMADGWHVALAVETEAKLERQANHGTVGVDLGVKALAVLSNGEAAEGPKPHKILLKRLRRLNQSLSRKAKGSANWRKAKAKLARLHKSIADIRTDAAHKRLLSGCLSAELVFFGGGGWPRRPQGGVRTSPLPCGFRLQLNRW